MPLSGARAVITHQKKGMGAVKPASLCRKSFFSKEFSLICLENPEKPWLSGAWRKPSAEPRKCHWHPGEKRSPFLEKHKGTHGQGFLFDANSFQHLFRGPAKMTRLPCVKPTTKRRQLPSIHEGNTAVGFPLFSHKKANPQKGTTGILTLYT